MLDAAGRGGRAGCLSYGGAHRAAKLEVPREGGFAPAALQCVLSVRQRLFYSHGVTPPHF